MRHSLVLWLVLMGARIATGASPQMTNVEPAKGKIGSVLCVTGVNLDKQQVDEVYLTDHTFDMMVKVLEQTEKSIKFRIPPAAKPGRVQLVIKTSGSDAILLEQPVWVTIEEGNEAGAAARR